MIKGSVGKIETLGLVDGPGVRVVIFLSGCKLRCKYCHNPETWVMKDTNYTSDEIVNRVLRNKSYYKNNGGVTFSGGEPLLQYDFLLETCKKLKFTKIHVFPFSERKGTKACDLPGHVQNDEKKRDKV